MKVKAVIMAGGKGTRFWPFSRSDYPKQFLTIIEERTMLETTVNRLLGLLDEKDIHVVSLQKYLPTIKEQLPMIPEGNMIIEPFAKDTAACIGLSAIKMRLKGEDPVLITAPSDQYISDVHEYHQALRTAIQWAEQDLRVVTLGIKPTRPETGYGYIRVHPDERCKGSIVPVQKFIEKPSIAVAKTIFDDGKHFWNSGTFIWKASTILRLIQIHMPELYRNLLQMEEVLKNTSDETLLMETYSQIEKISIDYGVIEKCSSIYMVPVEFGWDDMGNWDALERTRSTDTFHNIIQGLHEGMDTNGCIIYGKEGQLISTIGVKDLLIVSTEDVLLVCRKDQMQLIKQMYEQLEKKGYKKYL